jgi:hypothetical protein
MGNKKVPRFLRGSERYPTYHIFIVGAERLAETAKARARIAEVLIGAKYRCPGMVYMARQHLDDIALDDVRRIIPFESNFVYYTVLRVDLAHPDYLKIREIVEEFLRMADLLYTERIPACEWVDPSRVILDAVTAGHPEGHAIPTFNNCGEVSFGDYCRQIKDEVG